MDREYRTETVFCSARSDAEQFQKWQNLEVKLVYVRSLQLHINFWHGKHPVSKIFGKMPLFLFDDIMSIGPRFGMVELFVLEMPYLPVCVGLFVRVKHSLGSARFS